MVRDMNDPEYQYAVADEGELDELLSGQKNEWGQAWTKWSKPARPKPGTTGVVWLRTDRPDDAARPLVLISHEDDIRRLCGRYAQLHSDLSPLTTWCHLLTTRFFEPLDTLVRTPELEGLEAAWTGLIVAEAVLLAERPISSIRISACFATQSFAIARTNALWNHVPKDEVLKRFELANRLCRSETLLQRGEGRIARLRSCFEPIWAVLVSASQGKTGVLARDLEPLVSAVLTLKRARANKDKQEAREFVHPLLTHVQEAEEFEQLTDLPPETRLRLYDKLVERLSEAKGEQVGLRRNALALLAGYLATVAAGGAPSLSLTESTATRWPEITAWAYLLGGIGENVVWTSGFDGLGRLIARELVRPLRLDEPPTCDFSLDEANVIADSKLADPLVHLRVKQARVVTVALFPGVNVAIPIADSTTSNPARTSSTTTSSSGEPYGSPRDAVDTLIEAIWPRIRVRVEEYLRLLDSDTYGDRENAHSQRGRGNKKQSGPQGKLPLGNPKK